MRIPDLYFEDVLMYGDLRLEQVVVEYDYPLLSVLVGRKGDRFLSVCYGIMGVQRWIIAPVSVAGLVGLLTNRIALDVPFRNCVSNVVLASRDYGTGREVFREVEPARIPEECLPEAGECLGADDGEWRSYIGRLLGWQ